MHSWVLEMEEEGVKRKGWLMVRGREVGVSPDLFFLFFSRCCISFVLICCLFFLLFECFYLFYAIPCHLLLFPQRSRPSP